MRKLDIKKDTISAKEFFAKFDNPKDRADIEKYRKYYETKMLMYKTRKQLGLTQKQLAEMVKLPRTTITKLESGHRNVTVQTLEKIATAMGKKLVIEFR